jgi:hypothetical protein
MSHTRLNRAERHLGLAGSQHRRRRISVCVGCGLVLMAQAAVAGDARDQRQDGARPVAKPTVTGNLLVPVRKQLSLGFFLAQMSIRAHPNCAALFSRLGANGLEVLAKARYNGANFDKSSDACGKGGVAAYTKVGSHLIRLCPGFGVLSVPGAALILIHEALHSAGLSEKPADPNGLTPQEINLTVTVSCSL